MNILSDNFDLNKIKPKRLYTNKFATISSKNVVFSFKDTLIVYPKNIGINTNESILISLKDFFASDLDKGIQYKSNIILPDFDKLNWVDITINVSDLSVFSSISGIGEDTFIIGKVLLEDSKFIINTYSQTHKVEYNIIKPCNSYIQGFVDWDVFYYLFQMFKHLSGKKTDILRIALDKDCIYFSDINHTYYIIANQHSKSIRYKKSIVQYVDNLYCAKAEEIITSNKKDHDNTNTLAKTLIRPLNSDFTIERYANFTKFYDSNYTIYLNNLQRFTNG